MVVGSLIKRFVAPCTEEQLVGVGSRLLSSLLFSLAGVAQGVEYSITCRNMVVPMMAEVKAMNIEETMRRMSSLKRDFTIARRLFSPKRQSLNSGGDLLRVGTMFGLNYTATIGPII